VLRKIRHRLERLPRYIYLRNLLTPPPYPGVTLTRKRMLNLWLSRLEGMQGRIKLHSLPIRLTVEASNACNLECPACFTGLGETNGRKSLMTLDLYRRLLDELGDYLFELEFYSWGEPLLSKFIYEMISDATARGISTTISTNFSIPFDAARAERLVASGLKRLGVSLDGATQERYEIYRRSGNLELALRNCRLVAEAKRKLGSDTPNMIWEFHVFRHNVEDIERAKELAAEIGMQIAVSKGWQTGEEWDNGGQYNFFSQAIPFPCLFLWHYGVVNTDGGVAPCCGSFYPEDDMGKLSIAPGELGAATFREVWNGERFQTARRLFQSRTGSPEVQKSICYNCPVTTTWERWRNHRLIGRAPWDFDVGYSENDTWNYFWSRRDKRKRPGGRPQDAAGPPNKSPLAVDAAVSRRAV
jgi:pyruvate-formate lyase-activating enzyme